MPHRALLVAASQSLGLSCRRSSSSSSSSSSTVGGVDRSRLPMTTTMQQQKDDDVENDNVIESTVTVSTRQRSRSSSFISIASSSINSFGMDSLRPSSPIPSPLNVVVDDYNCNESALDCTLMEENVKEVEDGVDDGKCDGCSQQKDKTTPSGGATTTTTKTSSEHLLPPIKLQSLRKHQDCDHHYDHHQRHQQTTASVFAFLAVAILLLLVGAVHNTSHKYQYDQPQLQLQTEKSRPSPFGSFLPSWSWPWSTLMSTTVTDNDNAVAVLQYPAPSRIPSQFFNSITTSTRPRTYTPQQQPRQRRPPPKLISSTIRSLLLQVADQESVVFRQIEYQLLHAWRVVTHPVVLIDVALITVGIVWPQVRAAQWVFGAQRKWLRLAGAARRFTLLVEELTSRNGPVRSIVRVTKVLWEHRSRYSLLSDYCWYVQTVEDDDDANVDVDGGHGHSRGGHDLDDPLDSDALGMNDHHHHPVHVPHGTHIVMRDEGHVEDGWW